MGLAALLALFSLGAMALFMGDGDDPVDQSPAEPAEPDGPDIVASLGEDGTITSGEGDDTVTSGDGGDTPVTEQFQAPAKPDPTGPTLGSTELDDFDNADDATARYYNLQEGNDSVVAGAGNDTVSTGADRDSVESGAGDDLIFSEGTINVIRSGEGDDTIVAGDGAISTIIDASGANQIYNGDSTSYITASGESTIVSGDGTESLRLWLDTTSETTGLVTEFDGNNDVLGILNITVQDGDEGTLRFQERADNDGVDIYFGEKLLNSVMGAELSDFDDAHVRVHTTGGSISAAEGDDVILGSDFADSIHGGDGNDYISSGLNLDTGPDLLDGGNGNDTITALGPSSSVYYDPENPDAPSSRILEPNVMIGGAGDDLLVSDYTNTMTGGEGEDIFALDLDDISRIVSSDPSVITDFNPDEDVIFINDPAEYSNLQQGEEPGAIELTIWEDGLGADLSVGGLVIAQIAGGQNLAVEDILLGHVGRDLLGFN